MRVAVIVSIAIMLMYGVYQRFVIDSLKSENRSLTKELNEAVSVNKGLLLRLDEISSLRDKEIKIIDEMIESKQSNEVVIKEIIKEVKSDDSKESISILTARSILGRLQQQRDSNSSRG